MKKKLVKSIWISFIWPILAVMAVVFIYRWGSSPGTYLCMHEYALCTSAKCIPQPGDPTQAVCFCAVQEGKSMSTLPCKDLKPRVDDRGIHTVYSTFSFEQFKKKKGLKCPAGTPWTWCLNKRCTVDPANPTRAICVCDVVRTGEWMTLGGDCDPASCKTGYWSGATIKDYNESNVFMIKALGLDQPPLQWCKP